MQMTKRVGGVFFDAFADLLHDLQVDFNEIIAAHARLAGHAGRDDDNIGAFNGRIGFRAFQIGVKMTDRRALQQVKRLALRNTVDNIENDDIAQFLQTGQMCQRTADLTATDQCDFVTSHDLSPKIEMLKLLPVSSAFDRQRQDGYTPARCGVGRCGKAK